MNEELLDYDPRSIPKNVPMKCEYGDMWQIGPHRLFVGACKPGSISGVVGLAPCHVFCSLYTGRVPMPMGTLSINVFVKEDMMHTAFAEYGTDIRNVMAWKKPYDIADGSDGYLDDVEFLLWINPNGAALNDRNTEPLANRSHILDDVTISDRGLTDEKPLELYENQILLTTRENEIVFDPFGYNGAVLMACINTERVCYTIEEDPAKASFILARAQSAGFTARKVREWITQ